MIKREMKLGTIARWITIWVTILVMLFSTSALAFAGASIRMATNGAAGNYAPGAVLALFGRVEEVIGGETIPVPKTQVTITVSKGSVDGETIFSTQVNTDTDGYFRTNFNLPTAGLGSSFSIKAVALGQPEILSAAVVEASTSKDEMFAGCTVPFSMTKSNAPKVSSDTNKIMLVFSGNVNYFNNKTAGDLKDIGINSRNRDCFNLYDDDADKKVSTSVKLLRSEAEDDGSKVAYYDVSGALITVGDASNKASSRDRIALSIQEPLKEDTLYRLVISERLSKNNSDSLGEDKTIYFKTSSGESAGGGTAGGGGGGGASSGTGDLPTKPTENNTNVPLQSTVDGSKATLTTPDAKIDDAIKNKKEDGTNSLTLQVSQEELNKMSKDISELSLKLTASQVAKLKDNMSKVVYDTPFGTASFPVSVLAQGSGDLAITIGKTTGQTDSYQVTLTDSKGNIKSITDRVKLTFPVTSKDSNILYHDGKVMKNAKIDGSKAIGITKGFSTFNAGANDVTFADVQKHWAKGNIEFLAARGIVDGVGEDTFAPNVSVTRGQFVKFLVNGFDELNGAKGASAGFTDVKEGQWYTDFVNWAAENKIVSGTGDSKFGTNDPISRQDVAVMIDRFASKMNISLYAKNDKATFADDEKIASYAKGSVYRMQQAGIINGVGGNEFNPAGIATRGETAKMITMVIEAMLEQ